MGAGVLKGKKTYIVGVVSIISTIGAYLVGDVALADAAQLILTAVLGMTVRSGVAADK